VAWRKKRKKEKSSQANLSYSKKNPFEEKDQNISMLVID